jgi:methylenetetrahydrofolate dehydrogenase (NADP+) / methenyltetrahydrofolate cyclohydrolase
MATLLDGRTLGNEMRAELRADVQRYMQQHGNPPGLVIVRVGEDAASGYYTRSILRTAKDIGVQADLKQLSEHVTADELRAELRRSNEDAATHGIIVQMPLPAHLPQSIVAETLSAAKDVDGISPVSAGHLLLGAPTFLPSTAAAVIEILERSKIPLEGKHAVVLGRSNVVGKPLAMLLLQRNATVTICHSRTHDLANVTRQADILVAAIGRAQMVTAQMVRPGTTVIDVGINEKPGGGVVGDVDFASVSEVAGAITPTPGGVGPLTNVVLMKQCIQAAWQQANE